MSQFVESLRRLYVNHIIDKNKINELYKNNKITDAEKLYILGE